MQRRAWLQNIALGAVAAPSLSWAAEPQRAAPLPLDSFVRRPLMEQVRLSPDGKKMAALINNGNQSLLITRSLSGGGIVTVMNTDNLEFLFNWFRWVNNDRLVISLRYPYQRQIPYSTRVVPTMETRLLSMDADGSNAINVLRSKGLSGATGWAVGQDNANCRAALLHYESGTWTSLDPPVDISSDWGLSAVDSLSSTGG